MDLSHLSDLANRHSAEKAPDFQGLPGLSIFRRNRTTDIEGFIYEPVLCLILQGGKTTSIGDRTVDLTPGDAVLVSQDLPVMARITRASVREPYLALILSIDLGLVRSLADQLGDTPASDTGAPTRALAAGPAEPAWVAPLARYVALIDDPLDARILGPAIRREVHYRLLLSPLGGMLRQLLAADSHASRIAKAIHRLRAAYQAPLSVPDLARTAGMSASSFHAHFKAVTGTTPLRYQKDLRLIAARGLLVDRHHTVAAAAYAVGYESPTHFSRDYSRRFGVPPSRHARTAPAPHRQALPVEA